MFPVNSTIIFYATVIDSLLPPVPVDDSTFVILKDGTGVHLTDLSCVNYIEVNSKNITFSICNVQPKDSGVYQLIHISQNAELLTNRILIEIYTNATITISTSTSKYN